MKKLSPFLEYVLYDIFGESEPITYRPMMGSYILYYEGKAFAIVAEEELYLKGSKEKASWYLERGGKQFTYTKEGKDAHLYYYAAPSEVMENKETFSEWVDTSLSVANKAKNKG